jgi:hypothetical protein
MVLHNDQKHRFGGRSLDNVFKTNKIQSGEEGTDGLDQVIWEIPVYYFINFLSRERCMMLQKKILAVACFIVLGFALARAHSVNDGATVVPGGKKIAIMFSSYVEESGKTHFFVLAHGLRGMQLERMRSLDNRKITHRVSVEPPSSSEMDENAPCQVSMIFEPSPASEENLTFRISEPESNGPSIFLVVAPDQCGMVTIGEASENEPMTLVAPMSPQCPTGCYSFNAYSERCGSFKKCCASIECYVDYVNCKIYCASDCHGGE